MASTRRPTFARSLHSGRDEAPTGDSKGVPPLDKIPTNEFIEKFLETDVREEPAVVRPASRVSSGVLTGGYKRGRGEGSAKITSAGRQREDTVHPEDHDDNETVIDIREKYPSYDYTGQKAYEKACKKYGALPCSSFHKKLANSAAINMSYYNTGPRGAAALAIPMVINTRVTTLNLSSNDLSSKGMDWIGRMLAENTSITELNLSNNNLRSHGSRIIADVLRVNNTLRSLNISGNNFTDYDAKILAKPIEENLALRQLDLSNNDFGSMAGTAFRSVIAENGSLQELNLSWNHVRQRGAVDLAQGVKENIGLKTLLLGWNGFGDDGAQELGEALKTCTLQELDLTSNRIGSSGAVALCKGVKESDDIKILKLSKNPIPQEAASAIMDFFCTLDTFNLELLEFGEIIYNRAFADKVSEVQALHQDFRCPFGYMDSYGKRRLKQYNAVEEAMNALRLYCSQHNMNIVELFSRFDADGSMSVTHEEFKLGLKEAGIPLTDYHVEELIKTLDQDGDGEIDFSEMVLGAEMYKGEDA